MGRASLGALRSTPRGIVAAESGLSPTRALLNHRQAGFAQRLHARPGNSQGPEEILTREGSALTSCIRAAAAIGCGGTAETLAIYQALPALDQRRESGHRYTVFVDSTAAIDRVRSDALGPGQHFAVVGRSSTAFAKADCGC